MASIVIAVPPQAATTEAHIRSWSSELKRHVSRTAAVAVSNHGKVDITLRLFLFVFSLTGVVVMATSKQTKEIRVSPVMTIGVDAKFTYIPSFTYLIAAFSVIWLYSIITGYSSYSALKKQERSSISQQLLFVLLDSLILSISSSATGAAGGIAYDAFKGNHQLHWMKICNIFDTFCLYITFAEVMSLVTSIALLMLVWFSVCAIAKKSGR